MSGHAPAEAHEKPAAAKDAAEKPKEKPKEGGEAQKAAENVKSVADKTHADVHAVTGTGHEKSLSPRFAYSHFPETPTGGDFANTLIASTSFQPPVGVVVLPAAVALKTYRGWREGKGLIRSGKDAVTGLVRSSMKTLSYVPKTVGAIATNIVKWPLNTVHRLGSFAKNTVSDWWTESPGEHKSLVESTVDGVKSIFKTVFQTLPNKYIESFTKHPKSTVIATLIAGDVIAASFGIMPSITKQLALGILQILEGGGKALTGIGKMLGAP